MEQAADQRGESPALTYKDITVTYAELSNLTQELAAGLADLGLARDDRVGIYLEKRIETVAAIFATSVATAVFVPVNHILAASGRLHLERLRRTGSDYFAGPPAAAA